MQTTNGCGGKGSFINPPQFIFKASCNKHDELYNKGGNEYDRYVADQLFYQYMKEDVRDSEFYLHPYYSFWAWAYFKSVRIGGRKFFNYTS